MSNYDREQFEMDAVQRVLNRGFQIEVFGWTLLFFNAIPAMFIFVGLRSGSLFWTIWTLVEGFMGFVMVVGGRQYKSTAGTHVSRLGGGTLETAETESGGDIRAA